MNQHDLNQARTDPKFLTYLQQREEEGTQEKRIDWLYEVLDSYLVLDLEQENIDRVYHTILMLTFEMVEQYSKEKKMFQLHGQEIFYIRSLYEHAIEKWSCDDFQGAQALFFIVMELNNDELLTKSLMVHFIVCSLEKSLDLFFSDYVDQNAENDHEVYGYFIMNFQIECSDFLQEHNEILSNATTHFGHLLN